MVVEDGLDCGEEMAIVDDDDGGFVLHGLVCCE